MSTVPDNSDPNVPMENLLKAYAKQRREQAGESHEMHPATRRLLQGEVRRQFPNPARADHSTAASAKGLFHLSWRSLAFGLGLVVVMVGFVWTGSRLADKGGPTVRLAKRETPAEQRPGPVGAEKDS